jgi:hypothetical protein
LTQANPAALPLQQDRPRSSCQRAAETNHGTQVFKAAAKAEVVRTVPQSVRISDDPSTFTVKTQGLALVIESQNNAMTLIITDDGFDPALY